MASNITLSAGVRQNLLSLQSTAQLMSTTQNRLATGKKVNSALDNPANFFTSQALNSRAGDLNNLLDSIGQAVQTVKQADTGITALSKLVDSAKSLAKQAQQSTPSVSNYAAVTVNGTLGAETLGTTGDGTAITVANATTYSFTVDFGGGASTVSYTSDASATYAEILGGLQSSFNAQAVASGLSVGTGGDVELVANTGGDGIKINALKADVDMTIGTSTSVGLTAAAYNSTSLLDNLITAGASSGATLSATVGRDTKTLTFGTSATQISTTAELNAAISDMGGSASGTALSFTSAAGTKQTQVKLDASTATLAAGLGLSAQNIDQSGAGTLVTASETRQSYQNQYNDLLTQIDDLAKDASYNGINLLAGDDLKVVFNENGSSSLTIKGVDFSTAADLDLDPLTADEFQSNDAIDAVLAKVDKALSTLRTQAATFGSNMATVQTRQDFTKSMINNLQVGADNLVLADTNEEGANLLALQTRQQLSTTALSLSAQADQAVLRLF